MNDNPQSSQNARRSIADLFDDGELKRLFQKFLVLIGSVEIVIFLLCWIYQLGLKQFDRYGNVDVPFPWRTYFLLAFLVPVAITFMLGIFVVAFNTYVYGENSRFSDAEVLVRNPAGRLRSLWKIVLQLPFLFMLLLLGLTAGIIYHIDVIAGAMARWGEQSFKAVFILAAAVLTIAAVFGLVWMILTYRLRMKNIEYQYKQEVMDRLGIVFLDDKTVVNRDGRTVEIDDEVLKNDQTPRISSSGEQEGSRP